MGEEGDRDRPTSWNAVSGVSGFVPGCPLVRKGDGGVALSENLGDSIHGRRQLFRLLLRQVLAETRMESPSRLDLLAFDARHDAHQLNVGAGRSPRRAASAARGWVGCRLGGDRRRLSLRKSR